MADFQVSRWALVAILVNCVFWIMAMGGVSAVTYECHNGQSAGHCARGLQYEWWSCLMELFLLVTLLCMGYSPAIHKYKLPLVAFLVLVTGHLTWSARSFMVGEDDAVGQTESATFSHAAMNVAGAGYVLVTLGNYILIWMFGSAEAVTPPHLQTQKEATMTSSTVQV